MKPLDGTVEIYTDGACVPNPGIGGWAAVLLYRGNRKEIAGAERETTNNRMEMTAAIRALESLKRRCPVHVHTDSEYLKKGITEWLPTWKKRNWIRREGPVKNEDLWRRLDVLAAKHDVQWLWVKGHAGNELNERCDALATEALDRLKSKLHRSE